MGVNVDEAGGYDAAAGVDLLDPAARYLPDCGDFSIAKADVADEGSGAAPVENQPAAHDQIEVHKPLLEARRPRPGRVVACLAAFSHPRNRTRLQARAGEHRPRFAWQGGGGSC